MRRSTAWVAVGLVALAAGLACGWQQRAAALLRAELAGLRGRSFERARLRDEHQRLAAQQIPAEQLENLRADHAAIARLRAEIEALRGRGEKAAGATDAESVAPAGLTTGRVLAAAEWRNVGAATAPAALETALWAAAGGDVDALAGLFFVDAFARKSAQALFDTLPAEARAQYRTPERLLASLTIKDIPLGTAEVRAWGEVRAWSGVRGAVPMMTAALLLTMPEGGGKDVNIPLAQIDGAWKLLVIDRTVAKYAAALGASSPPK